MFLTLIWLGLAVGAASYLITSSEIFRPVREWVEGRSLRASAVARALTSGGQVVASAGRVWKIQVRRARGARRRDATWKWFVKLLRCPYCASHWIAGGATVVYQPRVTSVWWPVDALTTTLALVVVAMLAVGWIRHVLRRETS
jgi:hypothetical protein